MLEGLFGTVNKEKVLLYVYAREEGYPREVAKYYDIDLKTIQNQFEKLELGGSTVAWLAEPGFTPLIHILFSSAN